MARTEAAGIAVALVDNGFAAFRQDLRRNRELRVVFERLWPTLSPEQLVHDVFWSRPLLEVCARGILSPAEVSLLHRPRPSPSEGSGWAEHDIALLDEAAELLGPVPPRRRRHRPTPREDAGWMAERVVGGVEAGMGPIDLTMAADLAERVVAQITEEADDDPAGDAGMVGGGGGVDAPPVYGHILVDEAQDLSPMQWRMLARRCPSRSMTLVGDLGQATTPWAPGGWDEVLADLESRRPARRCDLHVNYRTPSEIMAVATTVARTISPDLPVARAVRPGGAVPCVTSVASDELVATATQLAIRRRAESSDGTVAVIAPEDLLAEIHAGTLKRSGSGPSDPLEEPIAVLTTRQSKGLEFDVVVVVEPSMIVAEFGGELRSLYVALTRATRFLDVVHSIGLPAPLEHAVAEGILQTTR